MVCLFINLNRCSNFLKLNNAITIWVLEIMKFFLLTISYHPYFLYLFIFNVICITISIIDFYLFFLFSVPARVVWAALERDAELPCDITPPTIHDSVKLVLWFKDTTGIPLYR